MKTQTFECVEPDRVLDHSVGCVKVYRTKTNLIVLKFCKNAESKQIPDEESWLKTGGWDAVIKDALVRWEEMMPPIDPRKR